MILLMSSDLSEFEIQINISSIRERFELLSINFKDNIDILLLTKTKMDQNFPDSQFAIDGYSRPLRLINELKETKTATLLSIQPK